MKYLIHHCIRWNEIRVIGHVLKFILQRQITSWRSGATSITMTLVKSKQIPSPFLVKVRKNFVNRSNANQQECHNQYFSQHSINGPFKNIAVVSASNSESTKLIVKNKEALACISTKSDQTMFCFTPQTAVWNCICIDNNHNQWKNCADQIRYNHKPT